MTLVGLLNVEPSGVRRGEAAVEARYLVVLPRGELDVEACAIELVSMLQIAFVPTSN